MNEVTATAGSLLARIADRHTVGTLAVSLTGAGTALLSVLKVISIAGGAVGAVFSAIAGFYAMRSAIRKWRSGN